jgi:hypothetical protein
VSASGPGRFLPPGKTRYPLYRRLGGPQGRSGQVRKISPPTGIRSPDLPARSQSLYRLSYPAHRLRFKEENYSERKWEKTILVSLVSYHRTWSCASERLLIKTVHFTIMDVLSQIPSLCTASPSCLWSRNILAMCGILSLLETGDRIQCSVIEGKNTFSRPNNADTVLVGSTEW